MFDQEGKPFTTRDQQKHEIQTSESVTDMNGSVWFTRDVGEIFYKIRLCFANVLFENIFSFKNGNAKDAKPR